MPNSFNSYIPKYIVDLNRESGEETTVTTPYFSAEGDVYLLDSRTIPPSVIQTTQTLNDLQPEVSYNYPFKIVPPRDFDSASIIQSPGIETVPTASQNYYATIYFERYNSDVIANINKSFTDSISISPISALLYVSEASPQNLYLVATITDPFGNPLSGQSVTWSSSNTNIVTVTSNGYLTAVSAGEAIVSASIGTDVSDQVIVTVLE